LHLSDGFSHSVDLDSLLQDISDHIDGNIGFIDVSGGDFSTDFCQQSVHFLGFGHIGFIGVLIKRFIEGKLSSDQFLISFNLGECLNIIGFFDGDSQGSLFDFFVDIQGLFFENGGEFHEGLSFKDFIFDFVEFFVSGGHPSFSVFDRELGLTDELGLVDEGSSGGDSLVHPEFGSFKGQVDLGVIDVHVFSVKGGSGLFQRLLHILGSVLGVFHLSNKVEGFVVLAGVNQEKALVDVFDHGFEVVDHLVHSLGFGDLLFLVSFDQVGHLSSVSEGNF